MNNRRLEDAILGYAAKFAWRYNVKLYALAIEGNHIQGPALFPDENRADFMRDLNSAVAKAVPRYVASYPGGRFWGRRYSSEFLPGDEDVEHWFFYTALQAVQDGHVQKISEYPGYNCFHDAIYGIKKKFKVVRWGEYNAAKRHNSSVAIKDFTDIVTLEYERLPGYEHLSQTEYATLMLKKLEERRVAIVEARLAAGMSFSGRDKLIKVKPGSRPKTTKTSNIRDPRPRVLSICPKRQAEGVSMYFDRYFAYKKASKLYRSGHLDVEFPPGMYRPYLRPKPGQN